MDILISLCIVKSIEQSWEILVVCCILSKLVSGCSATNIARTRFNIPDDVSRQHFIDRRCREDARIIVYGIVMAIVVVLVRCVLLMLSGNQVGQK